MSNIDLFANLPLLLVLLDVVPGYDCVLEYAGLPFSAAYALYKY